MAKVYRAIQHWNSWLQHFLGRSLLETEQQNLEKLSAHTYGKHAVLLGVPHQHVLFKTEKISNFTVLGPLINPDKHISYIEGDFYDLPLQSASVDKVILPHTLEYMDNPRQLLLEACRIVKPEGHIFIFGFNPYSLWGLKKYWMRNKTTPWTSHFIDSAAVKHWLALADFELVNQKKLLFRPPLHNQNTYNKLKFLEWFGGKCYNMFGGVYLLQAKAKVIPLTPIRLHWKQELSGVGIANKIISGSSIRNTR